MGFYQLSTEQFLPTTISEAWDFISSPENLKRITPPKMGFEILNNPPKKMYPGMIISYLVSPLPLFKTKWVTEITIVKEKEFFIDEQRMGPYKMWHHQHFLKETENGVIMEDIVSYIPPFGFLGNIANTLIVEQQLKKIFAYREKVLNEIFPKR